MTRTKYVYWCISHQQYVATRAREELQEKLRCKIIRLNLTLLKQVDFHKLSTWISSLSSSTKPANASA